MKNINLSQLLNKIKSPRIAKEYRLEYRLSRFEANNLRMFILTAVLFVEQLLLGLFAAEGGSSLQHVYFTSAAGMFGFSIAGFRFIKSAPKRVSFANELLIVGVAVFGLSIALGRFMIVKSDVFAIPVIYIAVLYGLAVIFVFGRWQTVLLYSFVTAAAVIFMPVLHPEIKTSSYHTDIISNGFIAMLIMLMNRRRQIQSFLDKKHIEIINQELREQSIRDGLTGLYNRRKLDEVFSEVCLKAGRYKSDFSLIMIDLDHFKKVNDNYGHHIGDSVLQEFSRILDNNIREVDVCGRWGGEEFLIICQETSIDAAAGFAGRLRESVEKTQFSSGLNITASFGVASWEHCTDEGLLLKEVDSRLYKAKEAGRNFVCSDGDCVQEKSFLSGKSADS